MSGAHQGVFMNLRSFFEKYSLYSWGGNFSGQLGQNDTISRSSPTQVGALTDWAQVAIGSTSNMAVKSNGTLWGWGANTNRVLGLGDNITRSSPTQVGALTNWAQVSISSQGCFAVKTDGTVWSWGYNGFGRLGQNNAYGTVSSPVQIGALTNWAQVSAFDVGCVALKTDATMWIWGRNLNGELGLNDTIARSSPTQIGALNWAQIDGGTSHILAVTTGGSLYSWGSGGNGRTGQNDTISRSSPTQIGALSDWDVASAAGQFSMAIKTNGTLWSFGANGAGYLGLGDKITRSSPTQVGALTNWEKVKHSSSGAYHTIIIKTDGTLWGWGSNGAGQVGDGEKISRSSPVQIGASSNWHQAFSGSASLGLEKE